MNESETPSKPLSIVEVDIQTYDLAHHDMVVDALKKNKERLQGPYVVLNEAQIGNWELVCNFAGGGYRIIKQRNTI